MTNAKPYIAGPTYPECLCRTCGDSFLDLGPYATFPGPVECGNCQQDAKRKRKGRRR